jgi:hypothetical protein
LPEIAMPARSFRLQACVLIAGLALLAYVSLALADPPARVARVGVIGGPVSLSLAGTDDWVLASINRPLTTGDRLWVAEGARAEVQLGGSTVRLGEQTGVALLNLDDRIAQLQLTQGTLIVRASRLLADQALEVDTPNLAFTLRRPGEVRIDVDPDGGATTIIVRSGQGEAAGDGALRIVDARQPVRFSGSALQEAAVPARAVADDLDRWSADRERALASSEAARHVAPDVIGYQDLDAAGSWRADQDYGSVWVPRDVAPGWAPYRDGHWAWVDPWGWTWVDDAPWGFAVSHYGRWANLRGTWGWVPGPPRSRAYYAPALVAFVGGDNFQLTVGGGQVGGVAWFPLAPREVYRPSYKVSRGYFENVNRSNTVINNTVIINNFNRPEDPRGAHANRRVPGAVIAVPRTAFAQSQPVAKSIVAVAHAALAAAPVAALPHLAPAPQGVRGSPAQAGQPPQRVFQRPVLARTAPPPAPAGLAAQRAPSDARPGRAPEEGARRGLQPASTAPAVTLVKPPNGLPRRPGIAPATAAAMAPSAATAPAQAATPAPPVRPPEAAAPRAGPQQRPFAAPQPGPKPVPAAPADNPAPTVTPVAPSPASPPRAFKPAAPVAPAAPPPAAAVPERRPPVAAPPAPAPAETSAPRLRPPAAAPRRPDPEQRPYTVPKPAPARGADNPAPAAPPAAPAPPSPPQPFRPAVRAAPPAPPQARPAPVPPPHEPAAAAARPNDADPRKPEPEDRKR